MPNAKVRFRDVWIGAFVTGLLWKGALEAFSWYMRDMTRFTRVNGSIAAVVVFLVWVYLQAVILLYGVEFTAAYARLQPRPADDVPAAPTAGAVSALAAALERPDDRLAEHRHVVRLARRDQVAVFDDRLVDVAAAGVLDVDGDRRPAGERAARSALAEMSSCGPWQMAATGLPASIASRARSTIAWRMRILSGAWPPGITSASKSFMRAAPAARSDVDDRLAALAA